MDLKRNGFLYKLAYAWAEHPPKQTNLCKLFWRLVLSLFVGWPVVVPLVFLVWAKVPTRDGLKTWNAWRNLEGMSPLQIIFAIAVCIEIVVGMLFWILLLFDATHFPSNKEISLLLGMAIVLGGIGWVLTLVISFAWLGTRVGAFVTTSGEKVGRLLTPKNVIREFLRAKKQKVCPIIRIV